MSSTSDSNAIDKKLSRLLRDHIVYKYTKNAPKSYQELLNFTIELEINNNELERKIESYKNEMFKLNQSAIDLKVELDENNLQLNSYANQMKLKEKKFKFTNIETEVLKNIDKSQSKRNAGNNVNITSSSFYDEISIDEDLKGTIKKKKIKDKSLDAKVGYLQNENKNLLNDLTLLVEEVKSLRSSIEEKDNIITILYQEIEIMKNIQNKQHLDLQNSQSLSYHSHTNDEEKFHSPTVNRINKNKDNFTFNYADHDLESANNNTSRNASHRVHLENLDSIRQSLVDFLKNFGIHEDFKKVSGGNDLIISEQDEHINSDENLETQEDVINKDKISKNVNPEYLIEIRMREIKYILVNLKKINIIFKTLLMEFSKNILTVFQNEYNNKINSKFEKIENKMDRVSIYINKLFHKKLLG